MFIYAGVRERVRNLGYVADYCPLCQEIRECRLKRVESYSHLYFIPLSSAKVKHHLVYCRTCGSLLHGETVHYAQVSKKKNRPLDELIAHTNPMLEDRLLARLETEERAAAGEVSEEQRLALIAQPFLDIEGEVRRHHLSTNLDWPATIFLVLSLAGWVVFCAPWFVNSPTTLMQTLSPIGAWLGGLGLVCLIVQFLRRSRMYVRKRFGVYLCASLASVNPELDELAHVLDVLRSHDNLAARKIKADWIIERLRETDGV